MLLQNGLESLASQRRLMSDAMKSRPVLDAALAEIIHGKVVDALSVPFDGDKAVAEVRAGHLVDRSVMTADQTRFSDLAHASFRGNADAALARVRAERRASQSGSAPAQDPLIFPR